MHVDTVTHQRLEAIEKRLAAIEDQIKTVDTGIRIFAGNITNLGTELLVIKQLVSQDHDPEGQSLEDDPYDGKCLVCGKKPSCDCK